MLYRASKTAKEGQLRSRTWDASLLPPTGDEDQRWALRCKQYWELQERLFGWRMSDFTMMVDEVHTEVSGVSYPVVSTFAVILEIMPGERTTDFRRVPAEMASARQ